MIVNGNYSHYSATLIFLLINFGNKPSRIWVKIVKLHLAEI